MLMQKVDDYLALRRAAGYALEVPEYHLRNFARFATQREETLICTKTVIEWASQAPSLNQREHRLQIVLRFARHLQAEDPRHEVPLRGVFRHRRTRPAPYIWTPQEVSLLLLLRFSTRSRSRFRIIGSRGKRRSEGGAERLKKTGERQAPPQVFNGYSYRRQSLERAIHRLSEAR